MSLALNELESARQLALEKCKGLGSPCIEIPTEDVSVVLTSGPRVFITVDVLIGLVNDFLSEYGKSE